MAIPTRNPRCPNANCLHNLTDPGGSLMIETTKVEYRTGSETGRPNRPLDVVFCSNCGYLFAVLPSS